jgi:hypothetical protein
VPKTERPVAKGSTGGTARCNPTETLRQLKDTMCCWVDHSHYRLGGRQHQPVAVREVVRHFRGEGTHGVHEGSCMVDLLPLVDVGSGYAAGLPVVVFASVVIVVDIDGFDLRGNEKVGTVLIVTVEAKVHMGDLSMQRVWSAPPPWHRTGKARRQGKAGGSAGGVRAARPPGGGGVARGEGWFFF